MEKIPRYEAGAEHDESEKPMGEMPMGENPKPRDQEEKKYFERSESSDSRSETRRFLVQAFMKKLYAKGIICQKEYGKCMDVIKPHDLSYEDLITNGDTMLYQRKDPLPEEFTIVFGFNEISALTLINKINRNHFYLKCVIVFNGVELANPVELANLAKSYKQIYSLIWLNTLNYPEILPLYEATLTIENLKEEQKKKKRNLEKEKMS